MKKKHFIFTTVCLLAGSIRGIFGGITKSISNESSLTMENVEALTDNEDGVVILFAIKDMMEDVLERGII